MKPLLAVLNPREIEECKESIWALECDQLWASYMTEADAARAINDAVAEHPQYTHIGVIADDCIVTQEALDAVLADLDHVDAVTGWCRLDRTHPLANVTTGPMKLRHPGIDAYGPWYQAREIIERAGERLPTGFMGFALTFLSRELWDRFPMQPLAPDGKGFASDFSLSLRLQDAGVPMWVTSCSEVVHVKERWGWEWTPDAEPRKRLLIGEREPKVRFSWWCDS
jgi:hypothetical protein